MKVVALRMGSISGYFKYCFFIFALICWLVVRPAVSAEVSGMNDLESITPVAWQRLHHVSFYFGHQSVGANILAGIELIKKDNPNLQLVIKEGHSRTEVRPGVLLQSKIGNNGDPVSKIKAFKQIMDDGLGDKVDVALFKFCFIDFTAHTNPELVFNAYKATMDELRETYPNTVFLHATVPLVAIEHGPKAWIKKLIGRPLDGVNDNIVRHSYNELLRKEFAGRVIFDLARAESTKLDGNRTSFTKDGQFYYAMVREYTSDGGHLNEIGRKHVAIRFLVALLNGSILQSEEK